MPIPPIARLALGLALLLLRVAPLHAQTSRTVDIELPVVPVVRVTVDKTVISLGQPSEAPFDLAGGLTAPTTVNVTVKANRAYTVSMSAARPTFLYTGAFASLPGRREKPVAELRFGTAATCGTGTLTALSTTAAPVLAKTSGGSANGSAGDTRTLCFNAQWKYAFDVPGNYSLALNFTVSTP